MTTFKRLYPHFKPANYKLSLNLPNQDQRNFSGTVLVRGEKSASDQLILHAKDLAIDSVKINDIQQKNYAINNNQLEIDCELSGELDIEIEFHGEITDPMHGLYPCYFEVDGKKQVLFATQLESHYAREVFPCIDEPEAKATFDIELITEPDTTVLSNMPAIATENIDNRTKTTFDTTPIMSSYLLAIVVGDLQKKSAKTKAGVDVSVYATKTHSASALDFALSEATKSLDYFADYFNVPYPLPKADQIALPDFESGAMENWGLVTYRESALLADPKTSSIDDKRYIAMVIAHELSHQWFGNLVTMKWWDDLWLNESFASIMEFLAVDSNHPDWDAWLDFSTTDAVGALKRDAIDGVQSVYVDVNSPDEITALFDGAIVYNKGARLMNMMRVFVGEESFRTGLSNYFQKHAFGNTVGSDLWASMSQASGKDVAKFMNSWLNQPGYPVVSVKTVDDGLLLQQEQFFIGEHTTADRTWPILLDASIENAPEIMDQTELKITNTGDGVFQLNRSNTGHYIVNYEPQLRAELLNEIKAGNLSVTQRIKLLHEQILLSRAEIISPSELIDVLDAYRSETTEQVWTMMSMAIAELRVYVENDDLANKQLRKFVGDLAKTSFDKLGWEQASDEPENDTRLRASIIAKMIYSEADEVINQAIEYARQKPIDQLDPQLRSILLSADVRHGDNQQIITDLINQYSKTHSPDVRSDIGAAITSTKDPEAIKTIIATLTDNSIIRPQDNVYWYVQLLGNRDSRTAAWNWVREQWPWIEKTFGSNKSTDYYPRYAGQILANAEQLSEYKQFFLPKSSDLSLKRAIEMGVTDISARVSLIERQAAAVKSRLNNI